MPFSNSADFRQAVESAATMIAFRRHQIANPKASDKVSLAHARRTWRVYVDTAIDMLATAAALQEQEQAARAAVN